MTIQLPNYTQIPNCILLQMMEMTTAEVRVTVAICRETFGWHRKHVQLSLSDLMQRTNLGRQSVINGIQSGIERGTIIRIKEGNRFSYAINLGDAESPENEPPQQLQQSQNYDCQGTKTVPQIDSKPDQAIKGVKETNKIKKTTGGIYGETVVFLRNTCGVQNWDVLEELAELDLFLVEMAWKEFQKTNQQRTVKYGPGAFVELLRNLFFVKPPAEPEPEPDSRRPAWISQDDWTALTEPQRDVLQYASISDNRLHTTYAELDDMIYTRWRPLAERLVAQYGGAA